MNILLLEFLELYSGLEDTNAGVDKELKSGIEVSTLLWSLWSSSNAWPSHGESSSLFEQ